MLDYTDHSSLLKIIKEIRENKEISLTSMSKRLGFKGTSGYANIEYGMRDLSFINGVKILQILGIRFVGVSIDDFTFEKLEKYRKDRGITKIFISRKLGFKSPSGYAYIEYGERKNLSFIHAALIAQIMNVEMEELFFA